MGKVNRNLAGHGPGRTHPRANAHAVRTGAMMRSVLQLVADRAAHGAAHYTQDRHDEGTGRDFKCRWFHSHPPYTVEDMLSKSHVQGQRRGRNTGRSPDTATSPARWRPQGFFQDTAGGQRRHGPLTTRGRPQT